MSYYRDLRSYIDVLEEQGLLYRFREPINKDSELLPLYRVQARGVPAEKRKAFLFENVYDGQGNQFDMGVVTGMYGLNEQVMALGMGCENPADMREKWFNALEHPIEPIIVASGPVHEVVITGDELKARGLDVLPSPVEEPGFSQMIRTGMPIVSKDPVTGVRNVGGYNAFFRDRDRMVTGAGMFRHIMRHWRTAQQRGEDLPIAIVIGPTPNLMMTACTSVPYGVDEMALAGGIAGEPMELVRCKTVPLEVPAGAEIVIEGYMSTTLTEPRLGFGEYPGYLEMERHNLPVFQVTAITHRKDALFTPVLVAYPPADSTSMSAYINGWTIYHHLKANCGLQVADVCMNNDTGSLSQCVVQLEKNVSRANTWKILQATASFYETGKFIYLVDWDINPRDLESLHWALSWRVRPEKDIQILPGRHPGLDPSWGEIGSSSGAAHVSGSARDYYKVLVDATMKGAYPPVGLPAREHMEHALEIWKQHPDLPEANLRAPWHGYTLGHWGEEDQKLADLIIAGDYKAVGRITLQQQKDSEHMNQ